MTSGWLLTAVTIRKVHAEIKITKAAITAIQRLRSPFFDLFSEISGIKQPILKLEYQGTLDAIGRNIVHLQIIRQEILVLEGKGCGG